MDNEWINEAVGAELRAARARRGWSREQLAERSGIPAATLRRYEDGTRSIPVDTLSAVVAELGLSVADIDRAIQQARPTAAQRTRTGFQRQSAQKHSDR